MEKEKTTTKDPMEKVVHQSLSVLQLAEAIGNVSEACLRSSVDRASFYEWDRCYGIEGLKVLTPIHHAHFQTTHEIEDRIIATNLKHLGYGGVKLSAILKLEGISASLFTTIKIRSKHNL